jgi:hypothetical protein
MMSLRHRPHKTMVEYLDVRMGCGARMDQGNA